MIDQYFTPDWLADEMAATAPAGLEGVVVDPAAGMGSLLDGLSRRFGTNILPVAIDSDKRVATELRRTRPHWIVSRADSLRPESRSASLAWRTSLMRGAAFVILNPPFSYRGGPAKLTTIDGFTGRLSPALSFVAIALAELQPTAGLAAILPSGVVDGQKYQDFWKAVSVRYDVAVVDELKASTFNGARAKSKLIRITPGTHPDSASATVAPVRLATVPGCNCIEIVRGRVPRHRTFDKHDINAPFIHTTDIATDRLIVPTASAPMNLASAGPLILLPRIGYPDAKICRVDASAVVLSDCVIGLRSIGRQDEAILKMLADTRSRLRGLYAGTGAPYLTVARLAEFLVEAGWNPRLVSASSPPATCDAHRNANRQVEVA